MSQSLKHVQDPNWSKEIPRVPHSGEFLITWKNFGRAKFAGCSFRFIATCRCTSHLKESHWVSLYKAVREFLF